MEIHRKVLASLITQLDKDFGKNTFIRTASAMVDKKTFSQEDLVFILYGIISLYFIDEVTEQPAEKINCVDMGSYYYRSESYSIDFPDFLHKKYDIPVSHIDRKRSLFISNKKYITRFLNRSSDETLGSTHMIVDEDAFRKVPVSRQEFIIEFFVQNPEECYNYIMQHYSSSFAASSIYSLRIANGYDTFLATRLRKPPDQLYFYTQMKGCMNKQETLLLTSSGTAANYAVMKYADSKPETSFYHKYWYFENLDTQKTVYFRDIKEKLQTYKSFFINIAATNYVDLTEPSYFENMYEEIPDLLAALKDSGKNHVIVLDVTVDPFYYPKNIPDNITIIRTISISKYQEGLNTAFAGAVLAEKQIADEIQTITHTYGLEMSALDTRFLYIPDITLFKERIANIRAICNTRFLEYKNWQIRPVGISMVIVPDVTTLQKHLITFSKQKNYTDREFAWKLRAQIKNAIADCKCGDVIYGDSFLFPHTRITIQGPKITELQQIPVERPFNYRLPRISPGYDTLPDQVSSYYALMKKVIDIYITEYTNL